MSVSMGKNALLLMAAWIAPVVCAFADNADVANKSNNPLSLAPGANLQDYYTPKLYDTNVHTNDALLRGTLPMAPNDFIGTPQLLRATLPISTRPDPHSGYSTGIGDLNLFDIFILKTEGVQLGIGPQITFDLKNNTHYIPNGFGGGKVWKSGTNILNAFIEPQWTVERKGDGVPQFTLFAGINVTFGT
ncbi:hypothetical protein [Pseudomonas sp. CLCA07]